MMTYVYHYHVKRQISPGSIREVDGVVTVGSPIDSVENFMEVRRKIASTMACVDSLDLIITSLTLLNPHG